MFAPIFLILLTLGNANGVSIDDLKAPMSSLLRSLHKEKVVHDQLDLVLVGKSANWLFQDDKPAIRLEDVASAAKSLRNSVKNTFACVIISEVKDQLDAPSLFEIIEHQGNSLALIFGDRSVEDLQVDERARNEKHLIYMNHVTTGYVFVHVWCAGHYEKGPQPMNVWKNNRFIVKKSLKETCQYVLSHRQLTISYNHFPPLAYSDPKTKKTMGVEVLLMDLLSEKFRFSIKYIPASSIDYSGPQNRDRFIRGNSSFNLLISGTTTFSLGLRAFYYESYQFVDFLTLIDSLKGGLASRIPIPKESFYRILEPLSWPVWIMTYLGLLAFATTFYFIHRIYQCLDGRNLGLIKSNALFSDFLIVSLFKFVEPDPVPWFRSFSTGKMVTLLWSLYTMIIIFSYTSNLRAHLMKQEVEKPVDTMKDALERGTRIFMSDLETFSDHKNPVSGHLLTGDLRALSERSYETKGRIKTKYGMFPEYVKESLIANGDIVRTLSLVLLYDEFFSNKTQGFRTFYFSKEQEPFFFSFHLRKHSPYREDMDLVLGQLKDMGLFKKFLYDPISLKARKPWTLNKTKPSETPLAFQQMALIFMLLSAGLLSALVSFTFEFRKKY